MVILFRPGKSSIYLSYLDIYFLSQTIRRATDIDYKSMVSGNAVSGIAYMRLLNLHT